MPFSRLLNAVMGSSSNKDAIAEHTARLSETYGKDGFEAALTKALADKRLRQSDIVGIAQSMGHQLAPRTSKKRVGEQLLALHRSLLTFRAKKRAMAGRSAA